MLIIWLQGIWLPLHGYDYAQTPLWAGIYLLPLTVGFLAAGPIAGHLSDRYGQRLFAAGGLVMMALSFAGLLILPTDFNYLAFAVLVFLNGLGGGLFAAPNTALVMSSVPAHLRGAASGMRATFQNAGMVLSIGVFFSLMVAGLAGSLPHTLDTGLAAQGVPAPAAHAVAQVPPVGTLFAAFLGYNPIRELLGPKLRSRRRSRWPSDPALPQEGSPLGAWATRRVPSWGGLAPSWGQGLRPRGTLPGKLRESIP
jgi:MFS family permease